MRKIFLVSMIFVIALIVIMPTVKASSAATIVDDLYNLGVKYGFTEADRVRGERYISENPITDEQAEKIYTIAQEALEIFERTNATNVKKLDKQLTNAEKKEFRAKCQEAADVLGVFLVYNNGCVDIYKDGKLIDTYTFTDDKLAYTGNSAKVVLVASAVAVIGVGALIVRKRFANE